MKPFVTKIISALTVVMLATSAVATPITTNAFRGVSQVDSLKEQQVLIDLGIGSGLNHNLLGGVTMQRGTGTDVGTILTFSAPPHLVGLVISNLYPVRSGTTISTTVGRAATATLTAYDSNNGVILDVIVTGNRYGFGYVNLDRGLPLDIGSLTLNGSGQLMGTQTQNAGIAALIVQVSEPAVFVLFLMGLIGVAASIRLVATRQEK